MLPVEPTPGAIARELSGLVDIKAELQRLTGVQLEQNISQSYQEIGQILAPILDYLQGELETACQMRASCDYDLAQHIEGQLSAAQGCQELCERAAAQERSRLRRMGLLDTIPSADVVPEVSSVGPQSPVNPQLPPATFPGPEPDGFGPSSLPSSPFGNPPTRDELLPLAVPLEGTTEVLQLGPLPAEYWDRGNPQRLWWSLQPTPLTRVAVPALRTSESGWIAAGQVYLNAGVPVGASELQALVDAIGVRQAGVRFYTIQETWDRAVAGWGEPTARLSWQVYGMQPPAPAPLRISDLDQRPDLQQPPARNGFVRFEHIEQPGNCPPVQVSLTDAFTGLSLPSREQVCAWLGRMASYLPVDQSTLPPCVTFQEAMRRFYG